MISLQGIYHRYKTREVLKGLNLEIQKGEIFGLLGPNGSGKTTLFRILSTAMPPSSGSLSMMGLKIPGSEQKIREKTGIVFQSPSLDGKLTVCENLIHQGHLYGISGTELQNRCVEMLSRLGILDRAQERVDKLSGGLKRRTELAKALLHRPELLILDEPSTGLDPGARRDLWKYLKSLQEEGVTILLTTHLMEEAEHCSRIAILHEGLFISLGRPEELKRKIHGDIISLKTQNPEALCAAIQERFGWPAFILEGSVQLEQDRGAEWVSKLAAAFEDDIESITIRKPTLEDVFIHETGHKFWEEKEEAIHV